MNVDKIAEKLRPLMPRHVEHWMRVRELADPELKTLIEKQIITTAYRHLGDFHQKILLSLPPISKSAGAIQLGTIFYEKEKWPFGISLTELMQNMAILGRSGAGKTNVAFHILKQLVARKIPFVFLDWKRTVRHLIPHLNGRLNIYTPGRSIAESFSFSPFVIPPGVESNVYAGQVVDVMSEAFTLGEGSRSLLRKAINLLYISGNHTPSVREIISEIDKMPGKDRVRGWKLTAMRALETLEFSGISKNDMGSKENLPAQWLQENTVIELDALGQETKRFMVPMLCLWLYYARLSSPDREKLKLVIFIEEAHHVLHKRDRGSGESILEMLFRQCRELGIGIIVLDQHPHLLSPAALGNTLTTICLNQKDPSDINKAAAISLLDNDEKKYFSMLPIGQGIVKLQDRWTKPFLIRFPLVNVKKGLVTDALLARYSALNRRNKSRSGGKRSLPPEFARLPRIPLFDNALEEEAFTFMEDVFRHPDDGVRVRYRRLSMSAGSGNRLKERLLHEGWLESQVIDLGRTRRVLLRLPRKAKEALGLMFSGNPERASMVHEYWKRFYAERFREMGYTVELEASRKSGAVDLLATRERKRIAVEIETGKSDIINNVRQNFLTGFERILIVATDKKALKKVEREVAGAGLMIPKRIQIVLRDEGTKNLWDS